MNEKILIIGPSWVGDMIMAQTLFKILHQQNPAVVLDVLAPNWSLPILGRMPEINRCIELPIEHGQFNLRQRCQIACQLRGQYQRAIVLTNSWKSALIPWLARIPQRTGWLGEWRWGLLNDVRYLKPKALPKMVQRYAALGFRKNQELPADLPYPKLSSPATTRSDQPILALCPGAAFGAAKRWPEEYFAALARTKLAEGWQVWFFGSAQDVPVIENIRGQISQATVSYAGKIDLLQTVDLFAEVSAVVSNDSGLMHLAAALDKPLIAIYGSTSPEFTPPLGTKARVIYQQLKCSPCFKRECPLQHFDCMRKIKPAQVIDALTTLEVA